MIILRELLVEETSVSSYILANGRLYRVSDNSWLVDKMGTCEVVEYQYIERGTGLLGPKVEIPMITLIDLDEQLEGCRYATRVRL